MARLFTVIARFSTVIDFLVKWASCTFLIAVLAAAVGGGVGSFLKMMRESPPSFSLVFVFISVCAFSGLIWAAGAREEKKEEEA